MADAMDDTESRIRAREDGDGESEDQTVKRLRVVAGLVTMDEELQSFAAEDEDEDDGGESAPADPVLRRKLMHEGFQLELTRLEEFESFTPCDRRTLQQDDRVLGVRWVEKWKKSEGGELVFRARFVMKDFADSKTFAFFAPTTSVSTSRILSCLAVEQDMKHFCFDASNAFLHAPVGSTRLFCKPPPQWLDLNTELLADMGIPPEKCVWRVLKAINGWRQGPQAWLKHATTILTGALRCKQCEASPCFFARDLGTRAAVMMEIHMDDIHG
eukprot:527304-Amphidinium_carterae.1